MCTTANLSLQSLIAYKWAILLCYFRLERIWNFSSLELLKCSNSPTTITACDQYNFSQSKLYWIDRDHMDCGKRGDMLLCLSRNTNPITTVGLLNFVANTTTTSDIDTIGSIGTYYYAIVASSLFGNSSVSNNVSLCTVSPPIPPLMSTISPNPNYNGSIAITWTAVSGATCYYVYRDTNPITTVGLLNFVANTTTTSDIDTIGSIGTYYYAIVASSLFGNSSVSNNVSVTVSPPIPPLMSTISPNSQL